ncbi:ATP-binding protein [Streptomyces sp. NPDC020983]|uniref:ATP-binding protein n=1 Tax=Streptomyces sp. NPDC020983 TaxID=3365106 RepID=UPI0037A4DFAE
MTKVVRHPDGKERPRSAPWYTLYPRRLSARVGGAIGRRWRWWLTSREARRSIVPNRHWRRWRLSFGRVLRIYAYVGTLLLAAWVAAIVYDAVNGEHTFFHRPTNETWFSTLIGYLGPFLVAAFVLTLFLLYWFHRTKRPLVRKARTAPHELVPTSGTLVDRIVGRHELAQVIAQTLRDRRTRKPYLIVGGVGVGKTAVLVELTRMLARQDAVPVPVRLRDCDGAGELDFEKLARRRFAEEADPGVLAEGQIDKTWRQLRLDDKVVVLADGLEEALLDDEHRDDRDNIIRRAIDRADRQHLPVVIASRPHAPLEGTRAAITELEPLSEEAALEYLAKDAAEADERRLDWIVETADISDSPIYLQVARVLGQHNLLDHASAGSRRGTLDTRSHDRSTLRLWLLDTYREGVEDGRLFDRLVMSREERQDTFWVVSALACLGLLEDSLDVSFDSFLGPDRQERSREIWETLSRRFGDRLAHPRGRTNGGDAHWLDPEQHAEECRTALARFAAGAQQLGLVKSYRNRVRFPHSIIQAYLGHRLLAEMTDEGLCRVVEPALRMPGPSRELLIALVLLSRRRAAGAGARSPGSPAPAGAGGGLFPRGLLRKLRENADDRQDVKFFDLYATALEIGSVDPQEDLQDVAVSLLDRWRTLSVEGDQQSVEEAKLRLVGRFGAALHEADRRTRGRTGGDGSPAVPQPYDTFFDLGTYESSHSVRFAIVRELAAGGDASFDVLIRHFPKGDDPVELYLGWVKELGRKRGEEYRAWQEGGRRADPRDTASAARRDAEHLAAVERYDEERARIWRYCVMRTWVLPMFVGSVSGTYRDEAKERLERWLMHLAPRAGQGGAALSGTGGAAPDLPLSLENALAQGLKNTANRRRRHPDSRDETRAYLVKQAERMLACSRYWHAQVILLQALCLWQLPEDGTGRAAPPGRGRAPGRAATDDPVRSVARWLSMAGTAHDPPAEDGTGGHHGDRLLHPFVAEAGDLVTLALETGHPERFLWIDEKGAVGNVGSTPADPERYRKHNLWIAPSVGWSVLHPRAQRLIADVLVMLNLTERNSGPDDIEDRLARADTPLLPPCVTHDRTPLHPERSVGRADEDEPGATCVATCRFRLCPYPPKAGKAQTEIEEPFCRQQQALLHSRFRWRPPAISRRTAPWVSIPVRELHSFWEEMANRNRTTSGDEPPMI